MLFTIGALKKTSLLDFPDKISTIVFTLGCNFRCGYCHNAWLLNSDSKKDIFSTDVFFEFLKKRQGKLDGVVISGGECTIQPDLIPFVKEIKKLNFAVKIDTNGYRPDIISDLLKYNLVDYFAMDIKAPLDKYSMITNIKIDTKKIKESINLIMNSGIEYEFRTTVLKSQLILDDFEKIGKLIFNADKYFLQKFIATSEIYDESLKFDKSYTNDEFKEIIEILKKYIKHVYLR